jgi:iron complex outermembrane receptor protein
MNSRRPFFALPLVALVFATLVAIPAFAQKATITGKVTDKKSKEALSAKINVPSARTGANAKADGTYTLSLPAGTHQLILNFPLYKTIKKTVTVAAGDTQTLDIPMEEDLVGLSEIVVLGTRRADRTVIESSVPIDIIPAQEMRQNGLTETNQMIQMMVPSFNFPRPSISDGTDAVRPATIRGLGPDQTLVLVNGKRRHVGSLVNVNGTVGRGSAGVDLNAIPANMVERIEVLRDGAAAQYGSDAIAGVINVILRKDAGFSANVTAGQTTRNDGRVFDAGLNYGIDLGNGSFIHIGGMYRLRDSTNRTGRDIRRMMPGAGAAGDVASGDWALDDPRRINHWNGDSRTTDVGGFINSNFTLGEQTFLYAFGGYTYRQSESYGFFRTPRDARNDVARYPNGFLPQIFSRINDLSAGAGVKGAIDGWNYDASAVYGNNSFNFNVRNSWNASLGAASPREFDAGTLGYSQTSLNLDVSKGFEIGFAKPLNIAFGGEYRIENYQIAAGDTASWLNQPGNVGAQAIRVGPGPARDTTLIGIGNTRVTIRIPASAVAAVIIPTPVRVPATQASPGTIPAAGSQVFPGFRPSDVTNQTRTNISAYLDIETDPVERFTVGLAGRFESYSDFGALLTGKFSTRYEITPGLAIRGAVSTGFRAPSLQQSFFRSTATNFINGLPYDISTFPVSSDAAKAFGAKPLKPETSLNLSAGITFDMIENLSLSVDYYRITIQDRITLSGNFIGTDVIRRLESVGVVGIGGGRFFTNYLNTQTQGIDVIARYGVELGDAGKLRFTAGFNWNENTILQQAANPPELTGLTGTTDPANVLFDRGERVRFLQGQPITNLQLSANYSIGNFSVMLRTQRFGEVTVVNIINQPALDQVTSGLFVTDLDISYEFFKGVRLAIGSNNIFDTMPQEWTKWQPTIPASLGGQPLPAGVPATTDTGTTGSVFVYPATGAPWGIGGRFLYARLTVSF